MLKSVFFAISALIMSAVCVPQSAIAGPILTQEFLAEDVNGDVFTVGLIRFDTAQLEEFFPGTGELLQWESFTLFGLEMDASVFFVSLGFNPADIFAGLEFISFDVNDISQTFAFNGYFDLFDQGSAPLLTVVNQTTGDFFEFTAFAPGNVSVVPAPASAMLMFIGLAGLLMRRRPQVLN